MLMKNIFSKLISTSITNSNLAQKFQKRSVSKTAINSNTFYNAFISYGLWQSVRVIPASFIYHKSVFLCWLKIIKHFGILFNKLNNFSILCKKLQFFYFYKHCQNIEIPIELLVSKNRQVWGQKTWPFPQKVKT